MRTLILAAALVAAPAVAQDRAPLRTPDLDAAATALGNPLVQDGLTALIGRFADVLLQTRVGPAAEVAGPRADLRPDDTLGDVIRRDDPAFDARLRDGTRRSLATTGRALGAAAAMQRELAVTAARLRAVLGTAGRD